MTHEQIRMDFSSGSHARSNVGARADSSPDRRASRQEPRRGTRQDSTPWAEPTIISISELNRRLLAAGCKPMTREELEAKP